MANYRCPVCGSPTPGYWEFCSRGDCPDGRDGDGGARYDNGGPLVAAAVVASVIAVAILAAIYSAMP